MPGSPSGPLHIPGNDRAWRGGHSHRSDSTPSGSGDSIVDRQDAKETFRLFFELNLRATLPVVIESGDAEHEE
jgi:hypothetical protein